MSFTPYDWNQSIQARAEYIEDRLREGSPVVGLSLPDGVLLLSVHQAPRKIYEIYDRLMFSGIGNQSDVEMMRSAALDFAHQEGYQRSPDDVTAQRLVGSVLSPALKRAFGDPFNAPFVFRGLFAELGERVEEDQFFSLGFDGEYRLEDRFSVVAGSTEAENDALAVLQAGASAELTRPAALQLALEAWAAARSGVRRRPSTFGQETPEATRSAGDVLRQELTAGKVEVGFLDRHTSRERRFRLLPNSELESLKSADLAPR